jgi:DNA-binding PadR family transcriptional regulator
MGHMHGHGGRDRHHAPPAARRGSRGRPFDYGALRLIVLGMIAEQPRHGYELMKAIEERMGGGYSPSPGVIYPTLAWLEDMGYAVPEVEGGRRSYRLTPEGGAFLTANRAALAELDARMGAGHGRRHAPAPVLQAMGDLKRALRARFLGGAVDEAAAERIAAAIRSAALEVEATMTTGMSGTLRSTASVTTPKAAGYAAQLCKHFANKVPAHFEGGEGEITFAAGTCRLRVEDGRLEITVEGADAEAVARLEEVVARHLLRFAFREEIAIDWRPA